MRGAARHATMTDRLHSLSTLLDLMVSQVDLLEDDHEDVGGQDGRVLVDELLDEFVRLLLLLQIDLLQSELVVELLDGGLVALLIATVVGLENGALLRRDALQSLNNQPAALVVLDVLEKAITTKENRDTAQT